MYLKQKGPSASMFATAQCEETQCNVGQLHTASKHMMH